MTVVTILGCGAAGGVPSIGAGWGNCDPNEPRNRRRRPSILVAEGDTTVLVDTSPDLREQLLDAGTRRLDAVLYTHGHADHLHGIDDLREVNRAMGGPIPIWATEETLSIIRRRFSYVLEGIDLATARVIYRPWLLPHAITGPFRVGSLAITPFTQDHGIGLTTGFRFGAFAYSTDVRTLPEASLALLEGIEVWVVGCLTDRPHETHAHVGQVVEWAQRLRPRRTIITHMGFRLDYATLAANLPAGIEPAYDGMTITV